MTGLTPVQLSTLQFVAEYGPQVDFGGRGADRRRLNATKQLVYLKLLSGSYRNASITDAGRTYLDQQIGKKT